MSVGGARDIRDHLEKAEKGGRLLPPEFLTVMDTLRAGRELRRVFTRLPDASSRYPRMLELADAIENFFTS